MADGDLTKDGERLVQAWVRAQEEVESCKRHLNSAQTDLINSQNALGRWLLPDDAKPGEKIAVWHGDNLIQAEAPETPFNGHDIKVTVRKRGKRGLRAA